MKLKYCIIVGLALVLTSCGGSKKASRHQQHTAQNNSPYTNKNFPKLEELPNPLEQKTPHFTSDVAKYIYQYKAVAMEEMGTYGIPASITLAQGILESSAGDSELTRKSNNHFGIKCHGWDGQKVYHDDDRRNECFRKYKNPNYSFRDHSLFLTGRSRYNPLFELDLDDYKGWARGLKKAGYATDPAYPRKLIGIIERYELYKYDRQVIAKLNTTTGYAHTQKQASDSKTNTANRYYTVKKGDTLYSISQRFDLTVDRLKQKNNLRNNVISIGQRLDVSGS